MQANPKSLADVLRSADRFVIPEYQRPYCWTNEEVEQLWSDLFESYREQSDASSQNDDAYFLGPIVVAKQQSKAGDYAAVVDGQQRLTTLHTLLWCGWHRLAEADGDGRTLRDRLQRFLTTASDCMRRSSERIAPAQPWLEHDA